MQGATSSGSGRVDGGAGTRWLAGGFVLLCMLAGCLVLWIGAPLAALWAASKVASSFGAHLSAALLLAILGMIATALGLAWLNDLFLRVTAERNAEARSFRSGPLEPMLVACLVAAIVAFLLWFLLVAENPSVNVY